MQWARVWPFTSRFCFEQKSARMVVSADQTQAAIMVEWKACNNVKPKRHVFDRRGRATVVLGRARPDSPWRAVHTHFSFDPASTKRASPPL
jgi:hypothetical protein